MDTLERTIAHRKVAGILSRILICDEEEMIESTHLYNDLNADSLDIAELTIEFEEEFSMRISDDQVDQWLTVGNILDTVCAPHPTPLGRTRMRSTVQNTVARGILS